MNARYRNPLEIMMSSEARIISHNYLEILSSVARIQVYKHFNKEMQKQYCDN